MQVVYFNFSEISLKKSKIKVIFRINFSYLFIHENIYFVYITLKDRRSRETTRLRKLSGYFLNHNYITLRTLVQFDKYVLVNVTHRFAALCSDLFRIKISFDIERTSQLTVQMKFFINQITTVGCLRVRLEFVLFLNCNCW